MKLEVGQFARLKSGYICKIININDFREPNMKYGVEANYLKDVVFIGNDDVVKAGYNIVDLIKSKDIILGRDGKIYQCWKIYKDYVFTYSKNKQGQTITLVDYQIDKVLTKEQFEKMAYKVGE
nr:MAG TPA: hypothetical protein [Caudoviricetes sp.]